MFSNEFKINKVDKYIYIKNKDKVYVIIFLCMDDMLILDNNDHVYYENVTNKFDIKKFWCVLDVILGVKITRIFDGLVLFQSHYVEKILDKCSKGSNSTVKILMDIVVHLSKNKLRE